MLKSIGKGQSLLAQGQFGESWELMYGLMVVRREGPVDSGVVGIAMPGDLLGLEASLGVPYTYTTSALTTAWVLSESVHGAEDERALLIDGFLQQQRQSERMVHLRTGPISGRMEYLIKLIAQSIGERSSLVSRSELPSLKDFAAILGIAVETACRELNAFLPDRGFTREKSPQPWSNKLATATRNISMNMQACL